MMEDAERIAEEDVGRELSAAEESSYWFGRGLDEILADPGGFVVRLGRKLLLLIGGRELSNNFDIYFFAHQSALLKVLMLRGPLYLPWGLVLPLALAGLVLARAGPPRRRVPIVFLLAYLPAVILFFVTARYRLPMLPVLSLFAGYALIHLWGQLRKGSRRAQAALGLLVVMLVVCGSNLVGGVTPSSAQGYHTLASVYRERGDFDQARRHYEMALARDSTLAAAASDLGLLYAERGHDSTAIPLFEQAHRHAPDNPTINFNLAAAYHRSGRWPEAAGLFEDLLREQPEHYEALHSLAMIMVDSGRLDSARVLFHRMTDPELEPARGYYNVGLTFSGQGKTDSAVYYFEKSLSADSTMAAAHYHLGMIALDQGRDREAIAGLRRFLRYWQGNPQTAAQVERMVDSLARAID
jgi:tetratricopeptide (TPR) repeat protein